MREKLIERLAEEGNIFISDLHEKRYSQLIVALLYQFGDAYSLHDWNEAIQYILKDEKLCFYSKEEALLFLSNIK